jgi:hypothetical protein
LFGDDNNNNNINNNNNNNNNNSKNRHLQFSPNFSEVCKKIDFTHGSINKSNDEK